MDTTTSKCSVNDKMGKKRIKNNKHAKNKMDNNSNSNDTNQIAIINESKRQKWVLCNSTMHLIYFNF